jgi:outer membrane autotransporter protein
MEVPVYAEVPELARQITIDQLDTFHDRQGAQSLLTESGKLPAAWARAWGEHASVATGGATSPSFSGTIGGVQVGHDVYADASAGGHRNHYGFFMGAARADGDVNGFALGLPGFAAGHLAINSYSLGGYWTHIGPGGWYTDTVLMGSTLTIDPKSNEGIGASTHGHSAVASFEAGLPIPLLPNLNIEPQAQLIWQHARIDDLNDGISQVSFHADNVMIGRLGVRLEGRFDATKTEWWPYLRTNLWRYFGGTDTVTYAGATVLPASVAATEAEIELGLVAHFGAHGSAHVTLAYTTNVNGPRRETVMGNAGVRWSW